MAEFFSNFKTIFQFLNILDIAIVAFIIYWLIMLFKETRAMKLLGGIAFIVIIVAIANIVELKTVSWMFQQLQTFLIVAIPVVFQPELRKLLEKLGNTGENLLSKGLNPQDVSYMIEEICDAIYTMSRQQIGVLLVLEGKVGLSDHVETGTVIDAEVSSQLLQNIFFPKAAMHDGATIIRGNRIFASGCILPLTEDVSISKSLGTRHRAAMGLSEVSDALIIVVSEETGAVSAVQNGRMNRYLDKDSLKAILMARYTKKESGSSVFKNLMGKGE